jgi:hypothetical protein
MVTFPAAPEENGFVKWRGVRLLLGILLVGSGFAMASSLSNARYPEHGFEDVVRKSSLLIPILIGATLIWLGRRWSILCLFSMALVLGGLAVALWGPEWGPGCRVAEFCIAIAYGLPGIWPATAVGIGVMLGLSCFAERRRVSRSQSSTSAIKTQMADWGLYPSMAAMFP